MIPLFYMKIVTTKHHRGKPHCNVNIQHPTPIKCVITVGFLLLRHYRESAVPQVILQRLR